MNPSTFTPCIGPHRLTTVDTPIRHPFAIGSVLKHVNLQAMARKGIKLAARRQLFGECVVIIGVEKVWLNADGVIGLDCEEGEIMEQLVPFSGATVVTSLIAAASRANRSLTRSRGLGCWAEPTICMSPQVR